MLTPTSSSAFTTSPGPPLIGALLRMPWEVVQRRMLAALHERGFDDLDAAHLNVFQYPRPGGCKAVRAGDAAANQQAGAQLPARRARAPRLPRAPAGPGRSPLEARRPHRT